MQYLLMLYSEEQGWKNMPQAEQASAVAAYTAYTQALEHAGVLVGRNRLNDSDSATVVHVADGKTTVIDGPYVDSKEQLGGYYLIDVPDLDAAIAWAARCPGASHGNIEVRPVWEMKN